MVTALLVTSIILLILVFIAILMLYKKYSEKVNSIENSVDETKIDATITSTIAKNLVEITNQFNVLKTDLNDQISRINKSIIDNLKDNTSENKEHLKLVTESITKVSESSKNLDQLNAQLGDLKNILNVTQKAGRYGEEILENILKQVFGETSGIYEFQKTLENGKKPDAVVNFPSPMNKVCIDSKFNFIEFNKLYFAKNDEELKELKMRFKTLLRKEIDKVSIDYYIRGVTSEFVILFMPNDSIFNYIQNDEDLYSTIYVYARKKNVVLASPSSLQPILLTMNVIRINVKTRENIDNIIKLIGGFKDDVTRLSERFNKLQMSLNAVNNASKDCEISIKKLVKKSDQLIENSDLELKG